MHTPWTRTARTATTTNKTHPASTGIHSTGTESATPSPHLYVLILGLWFGSLVWFGPRLCSLLTLARGPLEAVALGFFVAFTAIAWLYAFYNLSVVMLAFVYRRFYRERYVPDLPLPTQPPAVAILYTTYNDFMEEAARSCLAQAYPQFRLYILDDSTDAAFRERVDQFAAQHESQVRVVRRADRRGFKAGNLNHALENVALEPLFVLADADEILPTDFLRRLVPRLLADESVGFIQANHRANPHDPHALPRAMNVGVDIHWRWYQPLRNRYGFVMLLGHGAIVRRKAWAAVGGFPHLVSEDLAFALRLREHGWRGQFAEDVICLESFPENLRAFRVRFMKWTRGTCEFLARELGGLLRSRRIPIVEKLDVLVPTMSLPLSLFFFLYVLDANFVLMQLFGQSRTVSIALGSILPGFGTLELHVRSLNTAFGVILGLDFLLITLLAVLAPVLCFVIELARQPARLLRFVSSSVVVNGALGPLSCIGVLLYALTGKAVFHVTADRTAGLQRPARAQAFRAFLAGSHPDHWGVRGFEVMCGLGFAAASITTAQVSFLGLAIGYLLQPALHHAPWDGPVAKSLRHVPFVLILLGFVFSALSVLGISR